MMSAARVAGRAGQRRANRPAGYHLRLCGAGVEMRFTFGPSRVALWREPPPLSTVDPAAFAELFACLDAENVVFLVRGARGVVAGTLQSRNPLPWSSLTCFHAGACVSC